MPGSDQALWRTMAQAVSGSETSFVAFDDEAVIHDSNSHGVAALIDLQINTGKISGLAEPARQAFRSAAKAQAAFDLLLNDSTRKTTQLLAENGVPCLLLKGTPIAHLYYPRSYLRTRCDTDLYIDDSNIENCTAVLSEYGYQLSGVGIRKRSSKQFVASTEPMPGAVIHFDLHWKLSNRVMFGQSLPLSACLETSQPVPALGESALTLSPIDLLLHACIHRIAHGRNTERNRLIWLYDIHLLVGSLGANGLEQFREAAIQKAVGTLCADALEVVHSLFNTQLPEDFLPQLRKNQLREPSAKLIHSSKLRWAWEDLRAQQGLKNRVMFAKELLFD